MDEEQNNNGQNIGEKVNNNIQDTKKAVKDGTNLAKNASTGNILGAVKDGFKLLGNKKVRKTILIAILIPIILIIFLASSVYVIFDGIGKIIQEKINEIVSFFDVNWSTEEDSDDATTIKNGVIKIDDNTIDLIIKAIESTGVDLEDLKLMGDIDYSIVDKESDEYKEILRKYIRKFYEAQAVTQTLNTKPGWVEEYIVNGGEVYGSVYVYRVQDGNPDNVVQLKYMPYSEMKEKADNGKYDAIKNKFSVSGDKNGYKIVIAEKVVTKVSKKSDEYNVDKTEEEIKEDLSEKANISKGDTTTKVELKEFDYKNLISQYTTPMNFFIYLSMISQNPEFVSAVTDLVKDSKIDITIFDTETTNIEEVINIATQNQKKARLEKTAKIGKDGKPIWEIKVKEEEPEIIADITTTETVTTSASLNVTYAKTWFCEQIIKYNLQTSDPCIDTTITNASNNDEYKDEKEPKNPKKDGDTVTWLTNQSKTIKNTNIITSYIEADRGQVVDKTDDFIKLLDKKYRIPNSNRYEAAGRNNMVSGAEWLFSLMQKDPGLQTLEQVMRYIMHKYTGNDYGVNEFDFSIFNAKEFSSFTAGGIKVKTDESGALEPLSKQQLEQIIKKRYSGQAYTNLMGALDYFVEIQNKYHVSAVFAIAVTQAESSCGINWEAISPETHNWMSVTGEYNGASINGWRKYPDFNVAVLDFGEVIATGNKYFAGGNITIESIGLSYCNPPEHWIKNVSQFVKEMYDIVGIAVPSSEGNDLQQKVVEVAKNSTSYGIAAKKNMCQAWVADVYKVANVTSTRMSACCAVHAGQKWGVSTDWSQIPIGATVYGYSYDYATSSAVYGHVGIYIGDGDVAHNVGGVRVDSLENWIRTYDGVCWGWNGVDLTGGMYPFTPNLMTPNHE